eukprot:COSAG01_NODE_30535_length_614_cov_0.862136_1_plen_56_part_10
MQWWVVTRSVYGAPRAPRAMGPYLYVDFAMMALALSLAPAELVRDGRRGTDVTWGV